MTDEEPKIIDLERHEWASETNPFSEFRKLCKAEYVWYILAPAPIHYVVTLIVTGEAPRWAQLLQAAMG